jgi:hypothetical protein
MGGGDDYLRVDESATAVGAFFIKDTALIGERKGKRLNYLICRDSRSRK